MGAGVGFRDRVEDEGLGLGFETEIGVRVLRSDSGFKMGDSGPDPDLDLCQKPYLDLNPGLETQPLLIPKPNLNFDPTPETPPLSRNPILTPILKLDPDHHPVLKPNPISTLVLKFDPKSYLVTRP
ncbi:hypothetical protein TIFTF001_020543 [Ficus carica]|uniref:Uncharacterized protein n=1 Tax=Ficus carica TaxID=3494 RepID=A0AA88AY36_FICCA|nr:hypothetical protein TIFTF001_020543 [Ficus carica]